MPPQKVQPSIDKISFSCPHCGAYTHQTWFSAFLHAARSEDGTLPVITNNNVEQFLKDISTTEIKEANLEPFINECLTGFIFLENEQPILLSAKAYNLSLSQCYTCKQLAVWIHDRLISPAPMEAEPPSLDMPEDVRVDYEEAGQIINLSPRGSAALLRLAIQKLCVHLGESGKNINDDIASLVKKGLLPIVQQSLDSVRVIGNEAVHPGSMDMKDDRDTALQLFSLINIITAHMISHPKQAEEIYSKLPQSKKKGISDRDSKP
jgi:Domain of unknown function (DUF4145)